MRKPTVADFFWDRLHAWGVGRIYGYPGDGINGLLGGLDRAGDRFEFIQVRHKEMPDVPCHRFAEMIGLQGLPVDGQERLGDAWDTAWTATRPVVLEVRTDSEAPPLPPHFTLEQVRHFASAVVKGDARSGSMVTNTVRHAPGSILPRG